MLVSILKSKLLWLSLVLLALGILFGAIEQTYYQYIDENGVLHESWFFPLGFICFLLGGIILIFVVFRTIWSYFKNNRTSVIKRRGFLMDSQIKNYRDITQDYSDNSRRFILVLGECDEMAIQVIAKFAFEYQVEDSHKGARSHIVSLLAPVQAIPDMVRALAQNNIGIYQIIIL